eukprot:symbB.v1.2.008449.t1/scaffold429.1/size206233/5
MKKGYKEKGKAKTIGKGSAKAPPKPAGVMKAAMKAVKKAVAMKVSAAPAGGGKLKGKTLCFTGSLAIKRSVATSLAKKHGAKVTGSVSKSTDILVVGQDAGSKILKGGLFLEYWDEKKFLKVVGMKSEVVYAVPLPCDEAAQHTGESKTVESRSPSRPWVPPLRSFPSPGHQDEHPSQTRSPGCVYQRAETDESLKKDFQLGSQALFANRSWQSCSATTDAAAEAVCSQVSSSPTALAAQVVTVASNTTLASDVRELTEVETWSLGDARRIRVVDAPRVNFDPKVQAASFGS